MASCNCGHHALEDYQYMPHAFDYAIFLESDQPDSFHYDETLLWEETTCLAYHEEFSLEVGSEYFVAMDAHGVDGPCRRLEDAEYALAVPLLQTFQVVEVAVLSH